MIVRIEHFHRDPELLSLQVCLGQGVIEQDRERLGELIRTLRLGRARILLGANTGMMARAIVSHRIRELTDGTTHNHKRMDFIATWRYVVPLTAP